MKLFAAVLLLFGLDSCLSPTQSVYIDQSHNGGSGTGSGSLCGGIVASLNVDVESGSEAEVGDTIAFSAEPRTSTGQRVPDQCLDGPVTAVPVGSCSPLVGAAASLDSILFSASGAGECRAQVSFAGVTGVSDAVEIKAAVQ